MSGKIPRLKALESRKQLLMAESELNRAQLIHELKTMGGEVHALANQAKTAGSIASAAASLVAGLSSLRHKRSAPAAGKPPWWQTAAKAAGMVSTFWSALRTRPQP
jgi:hypothetical protein